MKIMQVIPLFDLGGAEIMCKNLIYGLKESGNEVVIVSLYNHHSSVTEELESKGFKIHYLNKKVGFDIKIFSKLKRIIKVEKPEAINTHLSVMSYVIPCCFLNKKIVKVHTVHSIASKEQPKSRIFLSRIFYKLFKVIPVGISPLIANTIREEYKIPLEKIPVIYNGIDLSEYIKKNDYDFNGIINILHIGRFSKEKNQISLINAFMLLKKQVENISLTFIGEGVIKDSLIAYVKENNLQNDIHFLGAISDVKKYLNQADIFVLPSVYEGMPITIIEAMTTALPIVATNVGGIPDMIKNEYSGILVENDVNKIKDGIYKFITDKNLRIECGTNARKDSQKFSNIVMAENYLKIYKKDKI